MASNNPFYGSSSSPSSAMPANGSTQRLALDNMIRRELKVGDPNDPAQIAQALLNRYKEDSRTIAISQEAKGLPFLLSAPASSVLTQPLNYSDSELQQAKGDVERDLEELSTNTLLKDITPEIQGWSQAIRTLITEGKNAARFGLDPRQRDKVFSVRRQLGLYARMARLVGALTPTMSLVYRKLGQSLDEVSASLLVLVGEAMANAGFGGNRFLLQIPYNDLQNRRDQVVNSLRNLIGSAQESFSQDTYSWGIHDYRILVRELENRGQGDLRILLDENELGRIMDEIIQRAARGSIEGLRQLGVTVQLDLERFLRLIMISRDVATSDSPALTSFLDTLALFVESFNPAGGFRLLRIARPAILFYGLYGMGTMVPADQRILQLTITRTLLADELDNYLGCDCEQDAVIFQALLDKVLFDIDRAIDLYAVGHDDFGVPEQRAAAYGYVICALGLYMSAMQNALARRRQDIFDRIRSRLINTVTLLFPPQGPLTDLQGNPLGNAQLWSSGVNSRWNPANLQDINMLEFSRQRIPEIQMGQVFRQELEAQIVQENELQHLVEAMAPARIRPETLFAELRRVLSIAIGFTQ